MLVRSSMGGLGGLLGLSLYPSRLLGSQFGLFYRVKHDYPCPLLKVLRNGTVFCHFGRLCVVVFISRHGAFFQQGVVSFLVFSSSFYLIYSGEGGVGPLVSQDSGGAFFSGSIRPMFREFFYGTNQFGRDRLRSEDHRLFRTICGSTFVFCFVWRVIVGSLYLQRRMIMVFYEANGLNVLLFRSYEGGLPYRLSIGEVLVRCLSVVRYRYAVLQGVEGL